MHPLSKIQINDPEHDLNCFDRSVFGWCLPSYSKQRNFVDVGTTAAEKLFIRRARLLPQLLIKHHALSGHAVLTAILFW